MADATVLGRGVDWPTNSELRFAMTADGADPRSQLADATVRMEQGSIGRSTSPVGRSIALA